MPDITMCGSEKCEEKEKCYRYMATPSEVQSYALFYQEKEECDFFIKLRK